MGTATQLKEKATGHGTQWTFLISEGILHSRLLTKQGCGLFCNNSGGLYIRSNVVLLYVLTLQLYVDSGKGPERVFG